MKYTIADSLGDNKRSFRWTRNGLSIAAIQHAADCGFNCQVGGDAATHAADALADLYEQFCAGACDDSIARIIENSR